MHRRFRIASLCFALLALAWAQVFGLVRGYVCDCGGEVSITIAEHCHGPHSVACHDQVEAHDDHDANLPATGGTTEHHDLLKETVVANQKLHTIAAPLPSLMLIAEMPAWTRLVLSLNSFSNHRSESWDVGYENLGRWPQVLTRTIAMRI